MERDLRAPLYAIEQQGGGQIKEEGEREKAGMDRRRKRQQKHSDVWRKASVSASFALSRRILYTTRQVGNGARTLSCMQSLEWREWTRVGWPGLRCMVGLEEGGTLWNNMKGIGRE